MCADVSRNLIMRGLLVKVSFGCCCKALAVRRAVGCAPFEREREEDNLRKVMVKKRLESPSMFSRQSFLLPFLRASCCIKLVVITIALILI